MDNDAKVAFVISLAWDRLRASLMGMGVGRRETAHRARICTERTCLFLTRIAQIGLRIDKRRLD